MGTINNSLETLFHNKNQKRLIINPQIGKVKYSISYNNGITKHKDGSDFYGIQIFKNKKQLQKKVKELINEDGYIQL